jgi:hypothetical protein
VIRLTLARAATVFAVREMLDSDRSRVPGPSSRLALELRLQVARSADERWRPGPRRVGRCAGCGAAVLVDEEHVAGPGGLVHGACAPVTAPTLPA